MTSEDPCDEDTFINPLAGKPPPPALPPPADLGAGEPQRSNDPDGTARMICGATDWLCTARFGAPLTEQEQAELQADLGAVLAKHDVPNLPFHEEAKLACTVGGIVFRRAVAANQKKDEPEAEEAPAVAHNEGVAHGNYSHLGQEGEREIRGAPKDMFSSTSPAGRAAFP